MELLFRFVLYTFFGLTLETIFAVTGIERSLGYKLQKRTPHKYLEGFVSLYMIPLHGLGMLFAFEWVFGQIAQWHWSLRYLSWCLMFTVAEIAWGFFLHKVIGFFPWDYYEKSKFRFPKAGYTLWTLIPQWGIAGLILELYSELLVKLSPMAGNIMRSWLP